jgi:hypothetical protein
MIRRVLTIVVCLLDATVCVLAATTYFAPGSDQGGAVEYAPGVIIIALYLASGAPALVLAGIGRSPKAALILALAFPAVLSLFFLLV